MTNFRANKIQARTQPFQLILNCVKHKTNIVFTHKNSAIRVICPKFIQPVTYNLGASSATL